MEYRAVMHDEATARRTGWAGHYEKDGPKLKRASETPAAKAKAARAYAATTGLPPKREQTGKAAKEARRGKR